ncbi:MAG: PAS domain S-box protein, partial [Dehalococcoidia bacterium]|nr:PAS domain S-box protein [Dehalococcoidia bacterium]
YLEQQHNAFEHTSSAATALEGAQAQFRREQAAVLSTLLFSGDSSLLDDYHDAVAATEQHLSQVRATALAEGEPDEALAIEDLTERIGQFNETVDLALPFLLAADPETRLQLATASKSEMWSEAEAIVADLQEMADNKQQQLAATRAAVNRAAEATLWLLVVSGTGAFLIAAGTVAVFIVSVVGPLAALRASARAITSGDLKARARISGPEEVASLARDFNEMTDALSAKTQEFIDTTNLTGVTLLRLDKDGRATFLNDATSEFLGRPKEEILGAQITDYLHPDDVEPTTQALRRMIKSKEPMLGAVSRYVTPMGIKVAEWNAYPLFDEQGQYAGLQGTGRDISERKQMEDTLRESEARYRLLTENTSDLIWTVDLGLRYTYMSPAITRMRGYTPEEVVGVPVAETMTPASLEEARKTLAEQLAMERMEGVDPNRATKLELEMYCKDGSTIWTEMNMTFLRDSDGKPVGILGVTRNISERKRAEDALRRQEYELAERAKELNCLYGISVLVDKPGISLQEVLQGTADLIPAAWQYPKVTCARI